MGENFLNFSEYFLIRKVGHVMPLVTKYKGPKYGQATKRAAVNYLARGTSSLIRKGISYTYKKYTKGKQSRETGGVTSQHDVRTVYRKRRAPKWKRKSWKRFVKKTNAVIQKNLGSQIYTRNNSQQYTATAGLQGAAAPGGLYQVAGTSGWCDDLKTIFQGRFGAAPANLGQKLLFYSCIYDTTFTNTSVSGVLEVDVYHIKHFKDLGTSDCVFGLANGFNALLTATGAAAISYTDRGITPFECPTFLQSGIRIVSKKKYFLSQGVAATYQIRNPKNIWISHEEIYNKINDGEPVLKKCTESLLFMFKLAPGSEAVQPKLTIGSTRIYKYVEPDVAENPKAGKI